MKKNGFTLIELMVAVALLSVLLVIMTGLFSRFMASQRRDIAELSLQEDIRTAMELMSREIRTGYGSTFALDRLATQPENTLVLRNQNGQCVEYRTRDGKLERAVATASSTQVCDDGISFGEYTAITGAQTNVQIRFLVPTNITTNGTLARQGFVSVVIEARSNANTSASPLFMQTTITSRQIQAYE